MNIEFFLKERTKFIKYFYESAVFPFENTKRLIEEGLEPYVPSYSEDSEPAFLAEWLEADTAIDTVGHAALSMLSSSIQLFLKEWVHQIERWSSVEATVNFNKPNGLSKCNEIFNELGFIVTPCPADINLIEQILLVRNRAQHPEKLTSLRVEHSRDDLKKYPKPFFTRDFEYELLSDSEKKDSWLIPPSISITRNMMSEAIVQVEKFCHWLDSEYWRCRNA